jgi:hypothetical protein
MRPLQSRIEQREPSPEGGVYGDFEAAAYKGFDRGL